MPENNAGWLPPHPAQSLPPHRFLSCPMSTNNCVEGRNISAPEHGVKLV